MDPREKNLRASLYVVDAWIMTNTWAVRNSRPPVLTQRDLNYQITLRHKIISRIQQIQLENFARRPQ